MSKMSDKGSRFLPSRSDSRSVRLPSRGNGLSSSGSYSSSKITAHFQTLDKMNVASSVRSLSSDDLHQARYASNRILIYVTSQDKAVKDQMVKNSFYIQSLLAALEVCKDNDVSKNILTIISELIGKTNTGGRCSRLVSEGATQVIFQFLAKESRCDLTDELVIISHQILSKLALKDKKFGVKARLGQALQVTLSFLRNHAHTSALKNIQPVLTVLRQYANNSLNASYLGKNGAINHLFKTLSNSNKKNAPMTKTVLDTLVLLVKSKSNSARAVGYGGVPILLQMYNDWHRLDTKNKHINLRKSILNILKHVTNLKSGRQAVIDSDGVRILYHTCKDIMDVQELEPLIFITSLILRKCFPRQKLPVNASKSLLVFKLPQSEFHIPQGLSKDAAQQMGIVINSGDNKDDDDSSVDNDDDLSSEDEDETNKLSQRVLDDIDVYNSAGERLDEFTSRRSFEDLRMYEKFFPEVFDIETTDEFDDIGGYDLSHDLSLSHIHGGIRANPHSFPNFLPSSQEYMLEDEGGLSGFSAHTSLDRIKSGSRNSMKSRLSRASSSSVSAINMKTGQPVFSLDIPISNLKIQGSKSGLQPSASLMRADSTELGKQDCRDGESHGPSQAFDASLGAESTKNPRNATDALQCDDDLDLTTDWVTQTNYLKTVRNTKSVGRFNKIAYPDLHGSEPAVSKEPLYERKFGVQRAKIFEDIDRMINPDALINKVVYDLDDIIKNYGANFHGENSVYDNNDVSRLGHHEPPYDHLHFNSQFESGNLRKAIQIRETEYDLILSPDVNTNHYHQWFYFEVSNMEAGKPYRFNIINNEKPNSQFNFGMRPVMYSVQEAVNGNPYWKRVGADICYFKNHLTRSTQVTGGIKGRLYFTTTFSITFKHDYDVCYIAYHYPYTYSTLQCQLARWESMIDTNTMYFKNQVLCQSVSGNNVNILTVTNYPNSRSKDDIQQFRNKPYIFLSCRVHPGESNASWIMKGTIEHLLSDTKQAHTLRDSFIFKIVPMLNPDGVINGNHRCSLTAEDLNRRWLVSCPILHPTIYHTKGALQFMKQVHRTPLVFCDYHGHSRKKNVFIFGCSPSLSWLNNDIDNPAVLSDKTEDSSFKTLPKILSQVSPVFSYSNCNFEVERSKESTARVVVWRQIGVIRSYTMESTYCGCDQGPYNGLHINTLHLQKMGKSFIDALLRIKSRHYKASLDALDLADSDPKPGAFRLDDALPHGTNAVDVVCFEDNLSDDLSNDDCDIEFPDADLEDSDL